MEKVKAVAEVTRLYTTGGMPPLPSTASSPTAMAPNRSGSAPQLRVRSSVQARAGGLAGAAS